MHATGKRKNQGTIHLERCAGASRSLLAARSDLNQPSLHLIPHIERAPGRRWRPPWLRWRARIDHPESINELDDRSVAMAIHDPIDDPAHPIDRAYSGGHPRYATWVVAVDQTDRVGPTPKQPLQRQRRHQAGTVIVAVPLNRVYRRQRRQILKHPRPADISRMEDQVTPSESINERIRQRSRAKQMCIRDQPDLSWKREHFKRGQAARPARRSAESQNALRLSPVAAVDADRRSPTPREPWQPSGLQCQNGSSRRRSAQAG